VSQSLFVSLCFRKRSSECFFRVGVVDGKAVVTLALFDMRADVVAMMLGMGNGCCDAGRNSALASRRRLKRGNADPEL
jgi:hypothetical protein